jgi:multiple sugar transport system permease protein
MKGRTWVFLVAPAFALFLVMQVGPLVLGIAYSFFSVTWQGQRFVGLDNFVKLWNDPAFHQALKNTGLYVIIIVPIVEVVGLAVALAGHSLKERSRGWFRGAIYLANRVSGVALLGAWMYLWAYNGIINRVLGIERNWYAQPITAFILVCITAIVWNYGGRVLLYLAGLDGQPREVQDAALVDGASGWQRFYLVTFPMMRRLLLYQGIMSVIGIAQLWEIIFLFTRGGPSNGTTSIGFYLWQTAYSRGEYGLSSAVGVIEMCIIGALSLVQVRAWRER